MWDTAGEVRTNSLATFSYVLFHTDVQVLGHQREQSLSTDTGCNLEERWTIVMNVEGESQGNPRKQQDIMKMIMMMTDIYIL